MVLGAGIAQAVVQARTPSKIVVLRSSGATTGCTGGGFLLDRRLGADGSDVPFTIPTGQVLVVTGFSWGSSLGSGNVEVNSLVVGGNQVLFSAATAGANNSVGAAVPVQNVVVEPSASFCVGIGGNSRVIGFLAPDR
jgi:hypothetical protein